MTTVAVPLVIRVGAHPFRVSRVRGLSDSTSDLGVSNSARLYIKIDGDKPPTVMTQIFLHELIHMALHIYNGGEKAVPHAVHDAIAEALLQFLDQLDIRLDFSALPVDDVEGNRENWGAKA